MPRFMPFALVRKDRFGAFVHRTDFPLALDLGNTGYRPPALPECWIRRG
jgi:hypothetical protein